MEQHKQQLTEAYEAFSDDIFRYCFFRISDREKALDLVSETYVRMWQYIIAGNEVANTKTFLYTVARNLIIDGYRKKKTVSLDSLLDQGMDIHTETEEALYTNLDIDRVIKHVEQLPEIYSSIIVMRYVNDLSIKEIATIVGKPENVISVRIHRVISKLRELIQI